MGIRFIGEFLLSEGLVTPDQLLAAMRAYDPERLGALAVRKGILTPAELESVQALYGPQFGQLGEKAVAAGLLTQAQLEQLITLQKSDWQQLRQNLEKLGVLTADQMASAVTRFRQLHSAFTHAPRPLPPDMGSRPEIVALISISEGLLSQLFFDNYLRIADPVRYTGVMFDAQVAVAIELSGDYTARYVMGTSALVAHEIGRRMLGGADSSDVDPHDVLGELSNNVVGSAASAFAATGRELRFGPPEPLTGPKLTTPIALGVSVTATIAHGEMRILIS